MNGILGVVKLEIAYKIQNLHGAVRIAYTSSYQTFAITYCQLFFQFQRTILDSSLGFAAGVMTAASFWSLLAPAIEMAEDSKMYGKHGEYAFLPVAAGFILGGGFVFLADYLMDDANPTNMLLGRQNSNGTATLNISC